MIAEAVYGHSFDKLPARRSSSCEDLVLFDQVIHCLCVETSALEQEFDGKFALDVSTACWFEGHNDAL